MESRADIVQFRLPVTWDIALRVLKHAARNGQTPFKIHLHGNGYLQLRQSRALRPTTIIDITLIASGTSTAVVAVAVTHGLLVSRRERRRVAALLEQFRIDAEFFASHNFDEPARSNPDRPTPQAIGEFSRLQGATAD